MSPTRFTQFLDLAVGIVLVSSFAVLWLRRLSTIIAVIALQGAALAVVALVIGIYEHESELVAVALMAALLRAVVLPALIRRAAATRDGVEAREIESLVNVPASLLLAALLTLLSYATTRNVVALDDTPQVRALPLGFAVALIGMLVMAARRKAAVQIIGLLMLDNGIALVMFLGTSGVPLAVEIGVAADALLAMVILRVLTGRIRSKFGATDLDQLREVRD